MEENQKANEQKGAKRGPGKVGSTAKENMLAVFTRLGGTSAMAEWAMANQTEFYKLYGRLIPHDMTIDAGSGLLAILRELGSGHKGGNPKV